MGNTALFETRVEITAATTTRTFWDAETVIKIALGLGSSAHV